MDAGREREMPVGIGAGRDGGRGGRRTSRDRGSPRRARTTRWCRARRRRVARPSPNDIGVIGDTHGVLDGAVEAEEFVDGVRVERRVVAPAFELGGVAQQREEPLPMRLTVVSWPATYSRTTNASSSSVLIRSPDSSSDDEGGQDVVAEILAAGVDHRGEVRGELVDRRVGRFDRVDRRRRLQRGGEVLTPLAHLVGAIAGHGEQVARSPGTARERRGPRRVRSSRPRPPDRARRRPAVRPRAERARSPTG